MRITSVELWNDLELKVINASKRLNKVDEMLCGRLDYLVNHFNGNLSNNKQYVCIESMEQIYKNIKRDPNGQNVYFRSRMYTQEEINIANDLADDLSTIIKILKAEQREAFIKSKENNIKEEKDRLPNINTDLAMKMFDVVENNKDF